MPCTTYRTLLDAAAECAEHDPDRVSLTFIREDGGREPFTAAELYCHVRAHARGLRAAGVRPDAAVILAMAHAPELIWAFLGALHMGAVPCIFSTYLTGTVEPESLRRRIAALAEQADAHTVVVLAEHAAALHGGLQGLDCRILSSAEIAVQARDKEEGAGSRRGPDDVAFLQFTSGSGGMPKGVAHTHRTVLRYIESKRQAQPIRAHDVIVSWLPLYHDLGLVSGLLAPLVLGVPTVLMSPHHWVRDPKILLQAIHELGGTLCFMPNFALNHCTRAIRARDLEGWDLSRWDALVCGAEPVREDSLRQFAERFAAQGFRPAALRAGYGMAEMVEGVTVTAPGSMPRVDWLDRAALQEEHRAEPATPGAAGSLAVVSCGFPMPGMQLRIVGDGGVDLPERAVGEVALRSPYMLRGYYRRPDLTARALRDGWLFTGDLGYLAGGELYVTGRKTDLIIVGGRNVHAEDIERVTDGIDGVHPGRTVAFGVTDATTGSERIVVVCEMTAACSDAEALALERELRRRILTELDVAVGDVRLVARGWIIKTSSGKHARRDCREKYRIQFSA